MLRFSRSSTTLEARISRVCGQTPSRSITPRSKLALTAGFVIAAVAVLVLGPHAGTVFAESDDSASFWRAEQSRKTASKQNREAAAPQRQQAVAQHRQPASAQRPPQQQAPRWGHTQQAQQQAFPRHMTAYAPVQQYPQRGAADNAPFWFFTQPGGPAATLGQPHAAPHHAARPAPRKPTRQAANFSERPRAATNRLVCVRLCDGFFFPAPLGMSANDAGCAAVCPNAPTRLYSMRSDRIVDAVAARDGAPYMNLPVALRYTQAREQTCSCGAADPRSAIMADRSLRSGDRYMTADGFLIYRRGGERSNISRRDFTPLAQTPGLPRSERNLLTAMERVSVARPSERMASVEPGSSNLVALGPPPRPLALR
ncbi:MAG: DUF2865 domain-containing protein [Beijerinckiaceae bacterium]|nr:DUF2865 domain-containing protein [Beijerinckiaceae bacterium]